MRRLRISLPKSPRALRSCAQNKDVMVPGTGLEPASREAADFLHTTSFDAARVSSRAFVRWTMPSPSRGAVPRFRADAPHAALGAPRLVSTPSTRPHRGGSRLGSALPRRRAHSRATAPGVSPNLRGSAPAVSGWALNHLSPLCLPISSPRQGRTRFYHCPQAWPNLPHRRRHRPVISPFHNSPH